MENLAVQCKIKHGGILVKCIDMHRQLMYGSALLSVSLTQLNYEMNESFQSTIQCSLSKRFIRAWDNIIVNTKQYVICH